MARIRRYLGRVELWLDDRERAALIHIVDALADGKGGGARIAPRAYDRPEFEAEYRRYIGPEVETIHRADVGVVREDLGGSAQPLRLDEDRALIWLRAINHLRLVAGGRLGIDDDGWEEAAAPRLAGSEDYAMLLDLGWVQQGIVEALEA